MTTEMQSFYMSNTDMSHAPAAMDELISKYSSTSAPAAFRTQRSRNPFKRFFDRVRLEYYRYEVTFGLYVMTPSEKLVTNSFVVVALSLLLWALLLYFPSLLYHKLTRLVWLLTGHSSQEVGTALGILEKTGNSISPASMAEHAVPS
jgi:hypothetical protein